jgi:hypothetical protein
MRAHGESFILGVQGNVADILESYMRFDEWESLGKLDPQRKRYLLVQVSC